jgi:hypothetical protein
MLLHISSKIVTAPVVSKKIYGNSSTSEEIPIFAIISKSLIFSIP